MEPWVSTAPEASAFVGELPRHRRYYRQRLQSLAHVYLGKENGGIVRDVSEAGVSVQSVIPLHPAEEVHLRFDLMNPKTRIESEGRVIWADPLGQSGIEFVNLSQPAKDMLKGWLLTQLLSGADRVVHSDSMFLRSADSENRIHLWFSPDARPPIVLSPQEEIPEAPAGEKTETRERDVAATPFGMSACTIRWLTDGLILLCSVLLFSVLAVSMVHEFPSWPFGLGVLAVAATTFAVVYRLLFTVWLHATPGQILARMATGEIREKDEDVDEPDRFR